jgi:hypothetical protein
MMEIIRKLFHKKENNQDKFVPLWIDMHLNQIFERSKRKAHLPLLTRLLSAYSSLKNKSPEYFYAEMLGAELNLFAFVCDRLKPEMNVVVCRKVEERYLQILYEPYRSKVKEAFLACKEMAQGYATNPVFGHRTLALAIATRLDLLHAHIAVQIFSEEFKKLEDHWEEDFKITLLDQYDKDDPAISTKAAGLKGNFRMYLLSHFLEDIVESKKPKNNPSSKSGATVSHLPRRS